MNLRPKEAIIIYIRKGETTPARYMTGIRKADTTFGPARHDLQIGSSQESVSESFGEFDNLGQAINAASQKLQKLDQQAATI